jgi:glutamate racemase
VLACTHFPLLIGHFKRLAPWPVAFVDPAPAIARRVDSLVGANGPAGDAKRPFAAFFTSGRPPSEALRKALRRFGLTATSAGERAAAG